ncbi:MAG: hypothetical protein HZB53_03140 [Chloroflexi bacterium]|nr:hypothetical protein [Chloroflexota bacterium]
MDGQEIMALEIGKKRAANMQREAARYHLAAEFGNSEPIANRLRVVVPMVFGLAAALAWLVVR